MTNFRWIIWAVFIVAVVPSILPSATASILKQETQAVSSLHLLQVGTTTNTATTNKTSTNSTSPSTSTSKAASTKKAPPPEWQKWFVLVLIIVMFILMAIDWRTPETLAFMGLILLWNAGIISATDAMSGFSNNGMLTVGVLFVVVHGVDKSQICPKMARYVFGVETGERMALLRMCSFCFILSAFLNNTPIVAMLTPVIRDWARARGFHPSTFLIPLSYATAAGGMVTIVGTSTTLVVTGLVSQAGLKNIGFFDIAMVALPSGALCILTLVWLAPIILPRTDGLFRKIKASNSDLVTEVKILPGFAYIGRPAKYVLAVLGFHCEVLVKIRRPLKPETAVNVGEQNDNGNASAAASVHSNSSHGLKGGKDYVDIFPVPQNEFLLEGDILFLSGGKDRMMDVLSNTTKGLQILGWSADDLVGDGMEYVEVVLGDRNPFVGDVVENTTFSQHYGVSILALRRKGRTNAEAVSSIAGAHHHEQQHQPAHASIHYVPHGYNNVPLQPRAVPYQPVMPQPPKPPGLSNPYGTPMYPQNSSYSLPTVCEIPGQSPSSATFVDATGIRRRATNLQQPAGPAEHDLHGQDPHHEDDEHHAVHLEVSDSKLKIGDALLLLAPSDFFEKWNGKDDFMMVQTIAQKLPPVTLYHYVPLAIFVAMVVAVAILDEQFDMLRASMAAAAVLILGGWVDAKTACGHVQWDLLLLIGAMLGVSRAMTNSGLADLIGSSISGSGISPIGALFLIYIIACIMTEIVTNNGAAGLAFPIAISTSKALGVSYMPFVIIVMFGATTSFLTPIGYQCNMMVWAPGGYSFADFTKMGIPMNIIYTLVICLLSPAVWPLNDERYILK